MRCEKPLKSHYAMIGMATVVEDYPLYYTTYDELEIRAINMHDVDLNKSCLYSYVVKGL